MGSLPCTLPAPRNAMPVADAPLFGVQVSRDQKTILANRLPSGEEPDERTLGAWVEVVIDETGARLEFLMWLPSNDSWRVGRISFRVLSTNAETEWVALR